MKYARVDWFNRTISACQVLVYAFIQFALPEWGIPSRFFLVVPAFVTAFLSYSNESTMRAAHFCRLVLSVGALSAQAACQNGDIASSEWGAENGCAHHSAVKIIILSIQVATDIVAMAAVMMYANPLMRITRGAMGDVGSQK